MKKLIALLLVAIISLTACSRVEATDEEYEKIGIHMAESLKHYDKNSIQEEVQVTPTTPVVTTTTTPIELNVIKEDEIDKEIKNAEIVDEISDENISIKYLGYELSESYPKESTEEVYAYVEAVGGTKIIVLKFDLTNDKDTVQNIKNIAQSTNFKLLLENKYLYSPINTLLTMDIITGAISLQPGETSQAVLVFQIHGEVADNLKEIKLIVTKPNKKEILGL